MVKEIVEVKQIFDDKVEISFTRQAACENCRAASLCGRGRERVLIDNDGFELKAGDRIEIEVDEKKSLLAGFLTFFLPAVLLLVLLIFLADRGEAESFFLAIFGLCIYYGALKIFLLWRPKHFKIRVTAKVSG